MAEVPKDHNAEAKAEVWLQRAAWETIRQNVTRGEVQPKS